MVLHLKIVSLLGIKQTETMKILNSDNYINEKLTIQPVTKDRLSDYKKPSVDGKARKFIEDNNLIWNPLSKSYDCEGNVYVSEDIVIDGKLKIRFGKVGGGFYCANKKLTALDGAPKEVGSFFDCNYNELTTLEGAPQKVGGNFSCNGNNLTILEGAPNEVCGDFNCSNNELTTLEGAPTVVGKDFNCSHNELTTLEGAPKEVGGDFYCYNNSSLVLPKEKPSWIKGEIIR